MQRVAHARVDVEQLRHAARAPRHSCSNTLGHGCNGVEVAQFETSLSLELPATFGDLQPSLINVAPLHGDIALLGEAGK